VQAGVAGDDVFRDPGAGPVLARGGAGAHHGFEGAVEAHLPAPALEALRSTLRRVFFRLSLTLKRSVYSTMRGSVLHHRMGWPSENQGKMPLLVGLQQALRRQVGAGREQAGRVDGQRLGYVGKRRIRLEPGDHGALFSRVRGSPHRPRDVAAVETVAAALAHFDAVGEEQFQRGADGREGQVVPGDLVLGEQLHVQAFDAGREVEVEQARQVEQVDLVHVGDVEQGKQLPSSTLAPASSSVSRTAAWPVVSSFSMKPAGRVQ
jgi:hypothetical protein